VTALWPAIVAALNWIDGAGDADGDGFVEYRRAGDLGLANQGWKDSHDAIFHADGRLAQGAIALAEVQGYVYAAKRVIARCARRLGQSEAAAKLETDAAKLAERFEAALWCPEIDTYALALDGAKEPCRVRSSNAGQVLFTGIAGAERAGLVTEGLLQPRFFSGWGIRTIAKGESRYNPMSYHDGSIWRWDLRVSITSDRSTNSSADCSTLQLIWSCGGCPSCSADLSASAAMAQRSIPSPALPRPGPVRGLLRRSKPRSGCNSIRSAARSSC
jgi:glycogen debranching enzyme